VLYIFGRESKESGRILTKLNGFKPHFWASCSESEATEHDLFGRPVKYIETILPTDVSDERGKYKYTCEANVLFPLRFIITKGLTVGYRIVGNKIEICEDPKVPIKILYFDIEVCSPKEIMPRSYDPRWPIVAISCSNSYDDRVILFLLESNEGIPDISSVKVKEKEILPEIRSFKDEFMLLEEFIKFVQEEDFDVLTAWNGFMFDFPYLFKRCTRLGVDYKRLSPFKVINEESTGNRRDVRIKGREAMDLLVVYQEWRTQYGQLPSYDFKYVVKLETGWEYTDYGDQIERLWKEDYKLLIAYCCHDAYALKLLDTTRNLMDTYDSLRRIVGCFLKDALSNKKVVDTWLLRIREKPLPTDSSSPGASYRGAVVLSPRPGLHRNVAVFDLKTMYPTAIVAYNLSPEMLDDNGSIVVKDPNTGEEIRFKRSPEGLMPKAVRYFLEKREYYREKKKSLDPKTEEWKTTNKSELEYKWLSASAYGVFGYPKFRLFDIRIAKAITAIGRYYVLSLITEVEKLGYRVVYGDTDSLFVQLKTKNKNEGLILESYFNDILKKLTQKRLAKFAPTIKFERVFETLIMKRRIQDNEPAKKRYAGRLETGELFIRGLEPRRSDSAELTRETITNWLELVCVKEDIKGASKLLKDVYQEFEFYPANKIGIPKGLQKETYKTKNPWVVGRDFSAKAFNYRFREDRKPLLVYVRKVKGFPDIKEICITEDIEELPEIVEVDWGKMKEKVLKNKFESLLEAIGLTWDEVVLGLKQTRLESYD